MECNNFESEEGWTASAGAAAPPKQMPSTQSESKVPGVRLNPPK